MSEGAGELQFYYGSQMPLRVLDEAEFWKRQEVAHTILMRELMDDLEQEYVDALKQWEEVLVTTHQQAGRYVEAAVRNDNELAPGLYEQVLELVSFCLQESVAFIQFCRQIKHESKTAVDNPSAKAVIDHIIDVSEYFIGVAQSILYEKKK